MKSIFWRNLFVLVGAILLSYFIFTTLYAYLSYNFISNDKRQTLTATANVVAATASAKSTEASLDDWDLRMMVSTVASASESHITICDETGVVRSCSDVDVLCDHLGQQIPDDVINEIAATGHYNEMTQLGGYYAERRYTAGVQIVDPYTETMIGCVFASVSGSGITEIWRPFSTLFVLTALAVLILSAFVSLLVTKWQVAPLRQMASAAIRLGKGNFDVRVDTNRRDDIGELADAFNKMAASLEKAEKSRREFVANVSHELKTPMTTISGFADGMLDGTIPPEQHEHYLAIISDETRRLARLVRRMLDISRMQSVDPVKLANSAFDVTEVVRQTLLSLEGKINDKGLEVEPQLPEEAVMVRGEADDIAQVLYNITDNAVKFARSGSVLKLAVWKRDAKAYVSVKDQGETIPPDDLPLIFDRFHKSDRSRSMDRDGVGLGLYIVKTILTGYGEDISVRSSDGETEFVFTLTLAQINGR